MSNFDPTSVTATFGSEGTGTATVSWTAPVNGAPGSYGIRVQSPAGAGAVVVPNIPGTATSWPVSGLVPGQTVQFVVQTNLGGYSVASSSYLVPPSVFATGVMLLPTQNSIQCGLPPNGTITAGGAVTLATALDLIYGPTNNNIPGIWLYFPATAFATAPAGFYFCVMTSTTVGTVYGPAWAPPGGLLPLTGTLTPVVGSGSAYTQTTATYVYAPVVELPANLMGVDSTLRATSTWSNNNSAGAKIVNISLSAASSMSSPSVLVTNSVTTTVSGRQQSNIDNAGSPNSQIWIVQSGFGTSASAPSVASLPSSVGLFVGCGLQIAAATDWVISQSLFVEVAP